MSITFPMKTNENTLSDHLIAQVFSQAFNSVDIFNSIDTLKSKTLVIKLGGSTREHQQTVLQDII